MLDLTRQPGYLEPIETAPVEELRALQTIRSRHHSAQAMADGWMAVYDRL